MHRVIKFNKKAWIKSYININTELKKNVKNHLRKDFLKPFEQCSFWKNYRKHEKTCRYQACNNGIKNKLFSIKTKLSYNKLFSKNLATIKKKKHRYLLTDLSIQVYQY